MTTKNHPKIRLYVFKNFKKTEKPVTNTPTNKSETELTSSILKKRSKMHKRLNRTLLIR